MTMQAGDVAAGSFVAAEIGGMRVLCLKAARLARDYVNHYLVPLDPVADRRALALVYVDPDHPVVPVEGVGLAFDPAEAGPEVGDAFATPAGTLLKVLDDPRAQKLFAYVDLATGQIRPRMERHVERVLAWRVDGYGA